MTERNATALNICKHKPNPLVSFENRIVCPSFHVLRSHLEFRPGAAMREEPAFLRYNFRPDA
jgi:hypothetical protein